MPHSLIFNLLPLSPISPNYSTGRHLHALFLTLATSVNQELGDSLHISQADKAFTLSPLQTDHPSPHKPLRWQSDRPIPADKPCWWRISLLDNSLFQKLTPLWLNLNPNKPWHLGSADLLITSILGTPQSTQPWANASTYSQLYEQASEAERTITFQFATPTSFRQGKFDSPFPSTDSVFNSLLKRWHKYSEIPINSLPLEAIFPSYFDIRTEVVIDSRSKSIGCVGTVSYKLLGEIEPLLIKQMNVLADFALYAGVGRKTTMGMGMVRRIDNG